MTENNCCQEVSDVPCRIHQVTGRLFAFLLVAGLEGSYHLDSSILATCCEVEQPHLDCDKEQLWQSFPSIPATWSHLFNDGRALQPSADICTTSSHHPQRPTSTIASIKVPMTSLYLSIYAHSHLHLPPTHQITQTCLPYVLQTKF